jgi:MoxR-like ATPase
MKKSEKKLKLLSLIAEMYPDTNSSNIVTRQQALECSKKLSLEINEPVQWYNIDCVAVSRGVYALPGYTGNVKDVEPKLTIVKTELSNDISESLIPPTDLTYVPFGIHKDVEKVIKSKIFYPTYIYGPTGNGKSTTVEQICAKQNRPIIRINLNSMTDEDQLIGTKTLTDGNVEVIEGPIVRAMRMGYVLLLDEIDAGNANTLLCLQPILEGKPFYFKLKNEMIIPADGFNIFATANTKGKGSEDGRYIGTNILNEAFLERFAVTMVQDYPGQAIELKIITNVMNHFDCLDTDFANDLVRWADTIRRTYSDGGIDENITTRRLIHIVKSFSIFKDKKKSVELCVNRFDESTRVAFIELFEKLINDDGVIEV